jgi:hypothetical protein
LNESEFRQRFLAQFQDLAFEPLAAELDKVVGAAWDAYANSRKAPRTRKAGSEFADRATNFRSTGWRLAIRSGRPNAATQTDPARRFF